MGKIYESGARNVKAVRALLDESKPIDKQLADLKVSDAYLFGSTLPKGTGKEGGEDDGNGAGSKGQLSTEAMYAAVNGIPFESLGYTPLLCCVYQVSRPAFLSSLILASFIN